MLRFLRMPIMVHSHLLGPITASLLSSSLLSFTHSRTEDAIYDIEENDTELQVL